MPVGSLEADDSEGWAVIVNLEVGPVFQAYCTSQK